LVVSGRAYFAVCNFARYGFTLKPEDVDDKYLNSMSLTLDDWPKLEMTAERAATAAERWDQLIKLKAIDDAVKLGKGADELTGEILFAQTRAAGGGGIKQSYAVFS
jgi:hypothetical protein